MTAQYVTLGLLGSSAAVVAIMLVGWLLMDIIDGTPYPDDRNKRF